MTQMSRFRGNIPKIGNSRKKEKIIIAGLASLALSLFLVFIVVFSFPSAKANTTIEKEPTVPSPSSVGTVVLYASNQLIRKGSTVSEFQFKEIFWPRNAVPEGAIRDLEEIKGKYANTDITENQPVLRTYFTDQSGLDSLPITPGMRAVTIEVDSKSGLEGWATPGTRVDVTLTYTQEGELTTKILVQNARVLSYAGSSEKNSERDKAVRSYIRRTGNTITLEVTPTDALKIQTSRQLGNLSLLMRAPEDNDASAIVEIDQNEIDGSKSKKTYDESGSPSKPCNKGIMKIEGEEYLIDCDGTLGKLNK